jgi:hypothetical protein
MLRRSRCAAHRRPFLAPSMVRRAASVWGSRQCTLDAVVARPIRPCCAEFSPNVRRPQAIVVLHAGAPPCRSGRHVLWLVRSPAVLPSLPISRRLLRPQSPFPRLSVIATFAVCWMRERDARWRVLSSPTQPYTHTHTLTCTHTHTGPLVHVCHWCGESARSEYSFQPPTHLASQRRLQRCTFRCIAPPAVARSGIRCSAAPPVATLGPPVASRRSHGWLPRRRQRRPLRLPLERH